MGILQDYDQEKEYNSGGKNQLAAALLLVGRIKFLKPECVVNAVTTAADSDSCMQREGRVFPRTFNCILKKMLHVSLVSFMGATVLVETQTALSRNILIRAFPTIRNSREAPGRGLRHTIV